MGLPIKRGIERIPGGMVIVPLTLGALIATFALQGAFRYQALDLARPGVRPHAGPLLYEKMFRTPYAVVRAAVDTLAEDGKAPWSVP